MRQLGGDRRAQIPEHEAVSPRRAGLDERAMMSQVMYQPGSPAAAA
ncbi:hypothetical protein ORI20_25045 [Mycobacterium sp. CVI_P3]|uniref:Uncharacterized protein n=1 Tax=Mycobacterium pinniadriaticum TaxID=2994102 RepID=A0ABT3SLB7_9MYCO|nr:hypothetical protein [Mycobacterium pinniadriaticum]MCX2933545.1 hypothetical protein [Mycobacterium pinniadriaticum]MCX2939954.1 hypothetical protein [Mycobacterium pinniadriaticum]